MMCGEGKNKGLGLRQFEMFIWEAGALTPELWSLRK